MRGLSMLIKPVSGNCNMRCAYCFYADVSEQRAVKSYGIMRRETLETLVQKALSEAEEGCSFGFQGGEPTLAGLDFYRELICLERKHNIRGIPIRHAIQTNGLCIDDAWAAFLAENHFLVGLSIDGPPEMHNHHRLDAAGKGTHNRCMAAARRLRRHNVQFNILSVVTPLIAAHPEKVYRFFKRSSYRHIQFIPCLDALEETDTPPGYALPAKKYGEFLCRLFDLWYEDFMRGDYVSIRSFDNYIHMLMGHPPENCALCGKCTPHPLIEADGSVYPCDFYALDQHRLGNVATHSFGEMLTGQAAQAFARPSLRPHPDCLQCPYGFICRGGCRRERKPVGTAQENKNKYCGPYRRFFAHALPRMQYIAKKLQNG